jgi:group I intron endonuclease
MSSSHQGKNVLAETRARISKSRRGKYCGLQNSMYGKSLSDKTKAKISAALSITVTILDLETNITTTYDSLTKAAEAINSNTGSLWRLFKRKDPNAPYRGRYIIKINR